MKLLSLALALLATALPAAAAAPYANPVLAGDYPDPSVIRVGDEYWATATSSEWSPQFPLLRSTDLVNWQIAGAAFTNPPAWAAANFWAPEIAAWQGKYFIYYTARKKGGPLSVAVATASSPAGPYTDHGPLVSQDAGSIDAVPVTDEAGERWLLWKEDGNSRKLPTPIWAQRLDATGTRLTGDRRELIRNDAPWEGGVVEGPFVLRRGDWFYLFYSGNGCCGRNCTYALGVARSKKLLGPWEKCPRNPLLAGNTAWNCPGHGSIVTDPDGRHWLVYHAYRSGSFTATGREMLLDEVTFDDSGWPVIHGGRGPSTNAPGPIGARQQRRELAFFDNFGGNNPGTGWQWPGFTEPLHGLQNGRLVLSPADANATDLTSAVFARSSTSGDYTASTVVDLTDLKRGAFAGIAAFGDPANALGIATGNRSVMLWQRNRNQLRTNMVATNLTGPVVHLQFTARGGNRFTFAYSLDNLKWTGVGEAADGGYLPPWDRSIRVALTCGGVADALARFDYFRIESVRPPRVLRSQPGTP